MLQWCRLFNRCRNLPPGHCVTGVQTIKAVSEPTCRALCYSGADCFSIVSLPAGHCIQGSRLFKHCRNLPAGHCVAGVPAV